MAADESPQFIGVGVGPGDPGLITLKAAEYIKNADLVAYLEGVEGGSQARRIAANLLDEARQGQREFAIRMPMNEDRRAANAAYDEAAAGIQGAIDEGRQVVFLCEGDPLFFGSYTWLLARLAHNRCEVVPGISSPHAAAALLRSPLTQLRESFAVVSGRHDRSQLCEALASHDSVVIMKAGRARPRILDALSESGRIEDAAYLEYIGRDNEFVETQVGRLAREPGPYFSLFVVTRRERGQA